ncbi:MAG: HAMP domain-containing sensor histidine kinase [Thermoleophilia bacterium]
MRRRLMVAMVAVAAMAVGLFAFPFGLTLRSTYRDEELLRLQRDAIADTRSVDLSPGEQRGIELPTTADRLGAYGLGGRLDAGTGPAHADALVTAALTTRRTQAAQVGSDLIAAVPLLAGERLTGVLRVARPSTAEQHRLRRAWALLTGLAAGVILISALVAWLIARRLAKPLDLLGAMAADVGRAGVQVPYAETGLRETDAVAERLAASARRIDEMVARERAFSADASHQLRTPLAALRIDLEAVTMRSDPPSAEIIAALGQVERLERTITTLLSAARDVPTERAPTDLVDLVRSASGRWRATLAGQGRDLRLDLPTSALALVHGAVISEVIEILVDNAVVHGAGTVTIAVRLSRPTWLAAEVRDEGSGVPAAAEIFSRRPATDGERHGIGLPLARALAVAEGGQLSLSHSGPKPCFTLLLPIRPPSPEGDQGEPATTDRSGGAATPPV